MSEMEPEVKRFLQKVVWTLTAAFLWLFINMYLGIFKELAFPEKHFTVWNILFYLFAAASLVTLVLYFLRLWKNEDL